MGLEGNGVVRVVPETREHCPTERQRQECHQLAQAFGLAEGSGFEVDAWGFEGFK